MTRNAGASPSGARSRPRLAWRLSASVSAAGTWLSTIPVIVLVVTPFYGCTDMNLSIVFFGIALALAAIDGLINRTPLPFSAL